MLNLSRKYQFILAVVEMSVGSFISLGLYSQLLYLSIVFISFSNLSCLLFFSGLLSFLHPTEILIILWHVVSDNNNRLLRLIIKLSLVY